MDEGTEMGAAPKKKWGVAKVLLCCQLLLAVLALSVGGFLYFWLPRVAGDVTVEAGGPLPTADDFLDREFDGANIVFGLDESMDMDEIADYVVVIEVFYKKYISVLHVVDTTAPVVEARDVQIYDFERVEASDFIESIDDVTSTELAFAEEPDLTRNGVRTVRIAVTDQGGNTTVAEAKLDVRSDKEAPVIEGVKELTVTVGGTLSYKNGVTVTDNYDDAVSLQVDNSQVDLDKVGDYPVTYTAKDVSGNKAEASAVVHVVAPAPEGVTEEAVYAAADKVLAQITKKGMSQYEVAQAIYDWVHSNVAYVDGSRKDNWVRGAYEGLVRHKGDCYVYAMTSKCLLTRAGIINMDIHKIPTRTEHYWNLIDIGEGWHHFDTTRRRGGATFFYYTDEQLMAYSKAHRGTHNYDRSLYPAIP